MLYHLETCGNFEYWLLRLNYLLLDDTGLVDDCNERFLEKIYPTPEKYTKKYAFRLRNGKNSTLYRVVQMRNISRNYSSHRFQKKS